MFEASNPTIGFVTCPHCGNASATVHREKKGKRAFYYRCYEGGACGTIQCRGPGGQAWVAANMRALEPVEQDAAVEDAAASAAEAAAGEIRQARRETRKRTGLGALLFGNEGEE